MPLRHVLLAAIAALGCARTSICAAAAAETTASVRSEPGARRVRLLSGDRVLAEGADTPFVSILFSTETDIWRAQTWTELFPDSAEVRESGSVLTIEIPSFGGKPVAARLEARATQKTGEVRWTIALRNGAPGVVAGFSGPALLGVTETPSGAMVFPDRPGHRLPDPWKALAAAPHRIEYPVPASMQWIAYTSDAGGVSLQVRDREMLFKRFSFGGPRREMTCVQFPFAAPGAEWKSPEIVWQALATDWHAAADAYRAWYRTWTPRPRVSPIIRSMPVVPGVVILARPQDDPYLKDVVKSQERGTYDNAIPYAERLRAEGYDGVHLVGWFGEGHDTTYPLFRPSVRMGGEEGLRRLVGKLRELKMIAAFYLNARLANRQSGALAEHPDWECLMAEGRRWQERYGDQEFALLCPAVAGWREHLLGETVRVAREYGGDGAQLDQVGAAWSVLCFDPRHGHRTPASAWGEGYPKMLSAIRDATRRAFPAFFTWVEGAWEGAGPWVDAQQGGFWPSVAGAEPFPQLYRYTLPEHPLFGDASIGGVPYWCPTDFRRTRRIYSVAFEVFDRGAFRDNIGLTASDGARCHWFHHGNRAVLTVHNGAAEPRKITLTLDLAQVGRSVAPKVASALAAGAPITPVVEEGRLRVTVEVPAGQIEAALLRW